MQDSSEECDAQPACRKDSMYSGSSFFFLNLFIADKGDVKIKRLQPGASELMEWAFIRLSPRRFLMGQAVLGLRCGAKFFVVISWIICGKYFNLGSFCSPVSLRVGSHCPPLCIRDYFFNKKIF